MHSAPTTVVLLRHGQSVGNLIDQQLINTDSTDFSRDLLSRGDALWPLTDLGQQQAQRAGHFLKSIFPTGFDQIFCSPFNRSQQTLAALRIGNGKLEPRIQEQDWGALNGPKILQMIDARHTFEQHYPQNIDLRPPGGETIREAYSRVFSFWDDQGSALIGRKTLIVSHWAPLFLSRMILNAIPLQDFSSTYQLNREILNCQIDLYSSDYQLHTKEAGWWCQSLCMEQDSQISYPWQLLHNHDSLL